MLFLVVQFSIIAVADRAVVAAAREATRVARAGGGTPTAVAAGQAAGVDYARRVGSGFIQQPVTVQVSVTGQDVTAVVVGQAITVLPAWGGTVEAQITGPVEDFRPDCPTC